MRRGVWHALGACGWAAGAAGGGARGGGIGRAIGGGAIGEERLFERPKPMLVCVCLSARARKQWTSEEVHSAGKKWAVASMSSGARCEKKHGPRAVVVAAGARARRPRRRSGEHRAHDEMCVC